jgi:hypothetical protein
MATVTVQTVTPYALLVTDDVLFGYGTVILPSAASVGQGKQYTVYQGVSSPQPFALSPSGTDRINGVAGTLRGIDQLGFSWLCTSDGVSNWLVSKSPPG